MEGMEELLSQLERKGIKFCVFIYAFGECGLSPQEVIKYLENKDIFSADRCGVPLNVFREYREWREDPGGPHCSGITKKGNRCARWVPYCEIGDFVQGSSDMCWQHQENCSDL